MSYCNPITAYGNIPNDINCNHNVMNGQGNAIPLQAVEYNLTKSVFEPNVTKDVNDFV